MNKLARFLGMGLLIGALGLAAGFWYLKTRPLPEVIVGEVDLTNVRDGVYRGEFDAGLVKVVVETAVRGNRIESIKLVEHQNGLGKKAEKIVEKIISTQSLDVAAVSGATLSSDAIRKAVEVSLQGN